MKALANAVWYIDVTGSFLMIILAAGSLYYALALRKKDDENFLWAYLLWVCAIFFMFSLSRGVGHIWRRTLLLHGETETWKTIAPYTGGINTFTFILAGGVTLFFGFTWKIHRQVLKDRESLKKTRAKLEEMNERLEELVSKRTRALLESERKYRKIFEATRDMVFTVATDGEIIDMNPAAHDRFLARKDGGEKLEKGLKLQSFLPDPDNDWARIISSINAESHAPNIEIDFIDRDNNRFRCILSGIRLISGPGQKEEFHFLVKDVHLVHKLKQQMLQADKLASIGELSAGIAHEINNPLGIILGYTQLLLRTEKPGSQKYDDLKVIERHVRNCKSIVEDLLSFARVSPSYKEPGDLHRLIEEVAGFVRHHEGFDDVDITLDLDPEPVSVLMDEEKMKQVMINLLMNAAHAVTGKKDARIAIFTRFASDKSRVEIRVEDNGHGISEDDLPKIFDPFFTTKPTGQGTGLGLSVSYGIVRNHGGNIFAESKPGYGACFTIVLPIARLDEDGEVTQ